MAEEKGPTWGLVLSRGTKPDHCRGVVERRREHVQALTERRRLEHVLTIGPNGRIKAQVFAKSVIVLGEVTGNVTASDKVDIRENGSVDGDIISPRVAIAEGAHFRGSVDMQRKGGQQPAAKADGKAAAAPQPTPAAQAHAGQAQRVGA